MSSEALVLSILLGCVIGLETVSSGDIFDGGIVFGFRCVEYFSGGSDGDKAFIISGGFCGGFGGIGGSTGFDFGG